MALLSAQQWYVQVFIHPLWKQERLSGAPHRKCDGGAMRAGIPVATFDKCANPCGRLMPQDSLVSGVHGMIVIDGISLCGAL